MADKREWEVSMAGALLGMGNPLLDISNNVTQEIFDKYGITAGNAILAEDKHQPLFKELQDIEGVQYIAGGATQNSIRVAQWMLQKKKASTYMGCVGKDENADKLKEALEKDGVTPAYLVDDNLPTGTCACCIKDKERSLVTNLGAASAYKTSHLKEAANMAILEKAKIVYSAGFFITSGPEAMEIASAHCSEAGKIYCLNLSAPFLMEVPPLKAVVNKLLPFVDFLFGNETEALTYAKTEGWPETDVKSIAKKLAALPKNGDRPRHVVITQGCDPTIVCVNGELTEYPIVNLPPKKLVDTNGAGDAYVGGFLSGLVLDKDIHYCCQAGAYAASVIVQRSGCTMPPKPSFNYRPPPKSKPLTKPKFSNVKKITPDTKGLNIMVKVQKVTEVSEGLSEAVCGDSTGVVTFRTRGEQAKVFSPGAILRVQNAKVVMVKGFIRVEVDKFGVVKPAAPDTPGGLPEIEVNDEYDASATEYERANA